MAGVIIGTATIFLAIQWLAAAGRAWARVLLLKKAGADDFAALFSLLCATGFWACVLALDILTRFAPTDLVPQQYFIAGLNLTLATELVYILSTASMKIAVGMLLVRIVTDKWQLRVTWSAMIITTLYSCFLFFYILFQCGNPDHFAIRYGGGDAKCLRGHKYGLPVYLASILNVLVDATFAALPCFFLRGTRMSKRTKISVVIILGTGSLYEFLPSSERHVLTTFTEESSAP